jgi:hypothetical protein
MSDNYYNSVYFVCVTKIYCFFCDGNKKAGSAVLSKSPPKNPAAAVCEWKRAGMKKAAFYRRLWALRPVKRKKRNYQKVYFLIVPYLNF